MTYTAPQTWVIELSHALTGMTWIPIDNNSDFSARMARAQKPWSPPGETLRGVRRSAAGTFPGWWSAAGVLLREVQAASQAPAQ